MELHNANTTIRARNIRGLRSIEAVAEGAVEIEREDLTLSADEVIYHELTDEVSAEGNVVVLSGEDRIESPRGHFVVHESVGEFETPYYEFTTVRSDQRSGATQAVAGHGRAERLYLEGENQYRAEAGTWTTCHPDSEDWYLKAKDLHLDYDRNEGVARGSSLVFKGVPLVYWPGNMRFPLDEQRQSGFLVPSVALSDKTGFDVTAPYYWNIAPNYDATIVPRYMSRRGAQIGGEFRYLSQDYEGEIRGEWMPHDRQTGESRGLGAIQHRQRFSSRLRGSIDYNAVTDDEYFEDLSSSLQVSSRRNLLRQGQLQYSGGWWNARLRAQAYQTLKEADETRRRTPYRRLPQFELEAYRDDLPGGLDFIFEGEAVAFRLPNDDDDTRVEGNRFYAYPQVALPIVRPGWYITPKFGVHTTRYGLDDPLPGAADGRTSISRTLPITTVDAGMTFERDTNLFDSAFQQTLEPRLYYVHIPYRDQDDIPRFDTASYDFGYAQLFSENRYSGVDRIGDANQITAAVTTRLIEEESGAERMRATLGQRYYFEDRRVALTPREAENASNFARTDILAQFSGRVSQSFSLDWEGQYSPEHSQTQRNNLRVRYHPEEHKVLNLSYRYSRDVLRDLDVSGQWPITKRLYGVGRVTRSIDENRITEALAGVEYVSRCGCWAMRVAAHRFAVEEDDETNALFFQLEFTGLGGIGPSPVNLLQRSVPGYGMITESVEDPWFGQ